MDAFDFEKQVVEIENAIDKFQREEEHGNGSVAQQITELKTQRNALLKEIYDELTPWQTVQVARHPQRPVLRDYIKAIFSDFIELHGDRFFGDDRALIGGFATLDTQKVMLIGHNKGNNIEENIDRNFGMARPEGYRKALRLMRLAEKYNIPIVTFIDTSGAYPGVDAEERGQHEAIARNLTEMAHLEVPIISIVTGEGGSGGALGIGVGDAILMLSYSTYSVISPEGCAGILWRDSSFSAQAAEALKVTAKSLLELNIIDEIIPEPAGGAHRNPPQTAEAIKIAVLKYLKKFSTLTTTKLLARRFEKFSAMGKFNE
jgi:acetyl-CoA carboxylase carboxyl transferase subunit alpha